LHALRVNRRNCCKYTFIHELLTYDRMLIIAEVNADDVSIALALA
jgi:hypothetical protein